MRELLFWSDVPGLYVVVVFGALGILLVLAVASVSLENRVSGNLLLRRGVTVAFLVLVCIFIFATRWPSLYHFLSFSIDEDQFVLAARTLVEDSVFFRSTEAGSSGPLNIYPLLLPAVFGLKPTLFSARVVGLLLICGSMTCLYFMDSFVSGSLSKAVTLLPTGFLGLTTFWDFSHYTSELTSVFLLSLGMLIGMYAYFRPPKYAAFWIGWIAVSAVIASMIPFAKLQAVYLGFFLGVMLLVSVALRENFTPRIRWIAAGVVSTASPPISRMLYAVYALVGNLGILHTELYPQCTRVRGRGAIAFPVSPGCPNDIRSIGFPNF